MDTKFYNNPPEKLCSRYHYRAFSLIELLVVVTIIAVLIALILPVVGMVRDAARQIRCVANTRQLSTAFLGYCADNDGAIPQGWITTNAKLNWCVSTEPYLDGLTFKRQYGVKSNRRAFGCTNVALGGQRPDGSWNMGDGNGYGINVWPAWDLPGGSWYVAGADNKGSGIYYRTFRLAHITDSSRRAWAGDSNGDDWGRDYTRIDGSSWRVRPSSGIPEEATRRVLKSTSGNTWNADVGRRHPRGQVNIVFFDGHAQSVSVQNLLYALYKPASLE